MLRPLLSLALAMSAVSVKAMAQDVGYIDACAKSLSINEVSGYSDEAVQLALLTYMISSSSDDTDFKSKFSGLMSAGFFSGSLSAAQQRRTSLEKDLKLTFSRQQAQGYLARSLSPDGSTAFAKCVATVFAQPGLHVILKHSDTTTVGISVNYRPQTGETRNFDIKVFTDGKVPAGMNITIPASGTVGSLTITKANPARDLHVQVDVVSGGFTVASQQLFVPPLYKTQSTVESKIRTSADVSKAGCGSYRDTNHYPGNMVTINATPGFEFDLTSALGRVTELRGERGKVPGPDTRVELTTTTPTLLVGRVWCYPGNDTDVHYEVFGVLEARETKVTYTVTSPRDNEVEPEMQLIK